MWGKMTELALIVLEALKGEEIEIQGIGCGKSEPTRWRWLLRKIRPLSFLDGFRMQCIKKHVYGSTNFYISRSYLKDHLGVI